jgi:hypothetical protein
MLATLERGGPWAQPWRMTESSSSSVSDRPSWQLKPGQSGNPGGRPKELLSAQKLARAYTTEAIEALVRGLKDPKHYVAAATALLDCGWGKPVQPVANEDNSPLTLLHLVAARGVAEAMQAKLDAGQTPPAPDEHGGGTINGTASTVEPHRAIDWSKPALE